MKLKTLTLKNFKAYKNAKFNFDEICLIVGKNDAGKSTVLHALNLFFNPKEAKKVDLMYKNKEEVTEAAVLECSFNFVDEEEINLGGEDKDISITETNLLDREGSFTLGCIYTESSLSKSPFVSERYIVCHNYDISSFEWAIGKSTLEQMNKKELDLAIKALNISKPDTVDGRENHWKRNALVAHLLSNGQTKSDIKIYLGDKKDERLSPIIEKFPQFKLFSNDKANSIDDKENSAVIENEIKSIIADHMKSELDAINLKMHKAMEEKLQGLNDTYHHFFGFLGQDNFKLKDGAPKIDFKSNGIIDNKGLSIENRGSGFRRLALLSLHLSSHQEEEYKNIIFAIEEPETSQNPHNQKGIIEAINKLREKGSQIIITTHSPSMAKEFSGDNIKYSVVNNDGLESKNLTSDNHFSSQEEMFDEIINLLGILPFDTAGKKLLIFVEGVHDCALLNRIEKDIFGSEEILFIPVGGNTSMKSHIALNHFKAFRLPYGGFLDKKKSEKDNCETLVKQALKEFGYENNFLATKEDDISKYQTLFSDKNELHGKLRGVRKIEKSNLQYFEEIEKWFQKFNSWKTQEFVN